MERLTQQGFSMCNHCQEATVCEHYCSPSFPVCGNKAIYDRLAAYEDTGLEPERVAELAKAERDGRLVELPVPVGDRKTVYGIYDAEPFPAHIVGIDCGHLDGLEIFPTGEIVVEVDGWEIGESDIGKTVFLTREEAEAALGGERS